MADTDIGASHALAVEQWDDELYSEYLGKLVFKPFMKTSINSPIHVKENLVKGSGDVIHVGLRTGLDGEGVEGDSQLEGNEEEIEFEEMSVTINQKRNAVKIKGKMAEKRVAWNMRIQAKDALAEWLAQKVEKDIAVEFNSINGVAYSSASEAQKDAWLADNADRVLFGAAKSNNSSNDHSSSLTNIDTSADKMSPDIISLAKRMALLGSPKIRPIKIENGVEFYAMFVHPYAFRDLKQNDAIEQAQREVFPRMGNDHPMLKGQAFIYWDGVVVIESDKVLLLPDVGNGGTTDVSANVLLGAQGIVYAQGGYNDGLRMDWVEEQFDYGNKTGFQVGMIYGVEKARFQVGGASTTKDHGMVTVYTTGVGD